jgi:DNA-binding transcriptional regulator GbsR (MarR family)
MELTGYSQATVSLTLQKLQYLMPIRTTRKMGDRKHYYVYDGTPERFAIDLWEKRLEAQAIDIHQIEIAIDNTKEKANKNPRFKRFYNYLENLHLYLKLVHELRSSGIKEYEHVLESESAEMVTTLDSTALQKDKLAKFLEELRKESMENIEGPMDEEYLKTKNDYYSGLKTNLDTRYSQTVANQLLVIHDIFLEQKLIQEQIEKSTLLPRSTISEILSQAVKLGIIQVSKKDQSRIKEYQPKISFNDLMLGNFDQLAAHIAQTMPHLLKFINRTKKIGSRAKEAKRFLEILKGFKRAYLFTRDFSISMKVEMVARLKEEYDRGFVFI